MVHWDPRYHGMTAPGLSFVGRLSIVSLDRVMPAGREQSLLFVSAREGHFCLVMLPPTVFPSRPQLRLRSAEGVEYPIVPAKEKAPSGPPRWDPKVVAISSATTQHCVNVIVILLTNIFHAESLFIQDNNVRYKRT